MLVSPVRARGLACGGGRKGLADRDIDTGNARVVHAVKHQQGTAVIGDGDIHVNTDLTRLCLCRVHHDAGIVEGKPGNHLHDTDLLWIVLSDLVCSLILLPGNCF